MNLIDLFVQLDRATVQLMGVKRPKRLLLVATSLPLPLILNQL